ncbi:hypothetical protein K488DRAFT_83171 [Vararia minispora EC-137]|uniref:Uncharacterized protein n=1 Tax=Vararia minispora EC-137 TaxID=1314806 RepID=A0ACB8QTW2_9AGAM|nr:hypothetical protein K488DRAFT_83171 [Vararia minispora EC-137]
MHPYQSHADDIYGGGSGSSSSRFLSASTSSPRKSPGNINRNRSSTSLRGVSIAQSMGSGDDDAANARFSLAHELAAALMPEPSVGSKLLAEEFGIEYDEGAEGIDGDDAGESQLKPSTSLAQELDPLALALDHDPTTSYAPNSATADDMLDPSFSEPVPAPHTPRRSEQDAMAVLSSDLETTDKLLVDLRRLDAEASLQPALERLALDWIRKIETAVRDREEQVRELLEYEREFRKISAEVGGSDALAGLPVLEGVEALADDAFLTPSEKATERKSSLDTVPEDEDGWEEGHGRGPTEDEDDGQHDNYGSDAQETPVKDSFAIPPPPSIAGPLTPAKTIPQLAHLRTSTSSLVSSLVIISEHAQVNGAATTEAGRKIRALKNKLGGWRTDWDSAERSRLKIERWEQESGGAGQRVDGRKVVEEHLLAFERALSEANMKTQAIMAAS